MSGLLLLIHFHKKAEIGDFNLKELRENKKIQSVCIVYSFSLSS